MYCIEYHINSTHTVRKLRQILQIMSFHVHVGVFNAQALLFQCRKKKEFPSQLMQSVLRKLYGALVNNFFF